jgi:hypothetical protein
MLPKNFWQRPPEKVAECLVAMELTEYASLSRIYPHGIILEVDAYRDPAVEKDSEIFYSEPGTIGKFSSSRGAVTTIAAHEKSKSGLITLRLLHLNLERYGTRGISEKLRIDTINGKKVGPESGLYFGDSGIDLAAEGLEVVDIIKQLSDGPENRIAYFALRKKR